MTALPSIACIALLIATPPSAVDRDGQALADHVVRRTWNLPRPVMTIGRPAPAEAGDGPQVTFVSVDEDPEGDMPRDVAYSPDGTELVIVHRDTDNVTFYDTSSNAAIATVPVGDFPVDVAYSGDGQYVIVPNVLDDTVTVIDASTHTVAATIGITGDEPFQVRTSSDGQYAIVSVINDAIVSAFSVIDLDSLTETQSIPTAPQGSIGFFFTPEFGSFGNIWSSFDMTSDACLILLPDYGSGTVFAYDRETGNQVAAMSVDSNPRAIDVSDDDSMAVVSHEGSTQTITILDLATPTVSGSVGTSSNLSNQAIRITPDNLYAIAAISNNVIFVNLTSGVTTATINTGTVGDIEISHDGTRAFVSNFNARVIDIASQTLTDTISFAACADAAISPTEDRAVALNNRFREDIHFYDLDGGVLESFATSGPPAEGDVPYAADISPDGSLVVACNVVSRNVAIIETATGTVRSMVEVGDRPKEVRITPDGSHAVVCAMDANALAIIDLTTDTVVASLPIFNRPGRVRISPDSQWAYVLNVAGTDRISFVQLDGASSSIVSQVSAGQTGSANGPTYTENSGIELSPDGTILAVCDSFNDQLRLYDTATRLQVASVGVGDFPLRVAFSPDGTRAYVVNHFDHDLSVIDVDGSNSSLIATVPGMSQYPITVSVDDTGDFVYVGTRDAGGGTDALRVVNATTNSLVKTVNYSNGYPRDSIMTTDHLLTIATDGELVRVNAAGLGTVIDDTTPLSGGAPDLAYAAGIAVVAQPVPDGVDLVRLGTCIGDLDGDGSVGVLDLLDLLGQWGPCPKGCTADLDDDDAVGVLDLLVLLGAWGACP